MIKNDGSDKTLLVIFALGLVLRLLVAFALENKIYWDDGFDYDKLAIRLLEGKGYVTAEGIATAFRAPVYSYFLAGAYAIFGHDFILVRIIQCLLDSVTLLVIFAIARLLFDRSVATIAASIYALYPLLIYSANTFFPTTLFTLLLSLATWSLFQLKQQATAFRSALLGVIFGISVLTVPTILAFIPLALVWLFFALEKKGGKFIFNAGIIIVMMGVVLSPWLIRNQKVFNKSLLIATNGGYNFWMGNNPLAKGSTGNGIKPPEYLAQQLSRAKSEIEKEQLFYHDAFQFVKKEPARFIGLTIQKALNLWRFYPTPDTGYKILPALSKILSAITYTPVLILALLGIILSGSRKREVVLLLLLFLAVTVSYSLFITKVRFRLPLDPYLIVLASYALSELKIKVFKV